MDSWPLSLATHSARIYFLKMLPDAKWLDAVKLPVRSKLAIAAACAVLFYLFKTKVLSVGSFDGLVVALLLVAIVVFITLSVFDGAAWLGQPIAEKRRLSLLKKRRAALRAEKDAEREERRAAVLAQLDHLSRWEVKVLAGVLEGGSPTFYDYVYSPPITMLQAKYLVWTPGGTHNQDHYPFCISDFVWDELQNRREEFFEKEQAFQAIEAANKRAGKPNPW